MIKVDNIITLWRSVIPNMAHSSNYQVTMYPFFAPLQPRPGCTLLEHSWTLKKIQQHLKLRGSLIDMFMFLDLEHCARRFKLHKRRFVWI